MHKSCRLSYLTLTCLLLLATFTNLACVKREAGVAGNESRLNVAQNPSVPNDARAATLPDSVNANAQPDATTGTNLAESEIDSAAQQNARLMTDLEWTFGGKTQRGWYLYVPLINELIGTDKNPDTNGFAEALKRWQRSNNFTANGILDPDTLLHIIAVWQERRSKDHTIATPDILLTAPPSDFYAPTRPEELRKVETQTYAAYKRMVAAALLDRSLNLAATRKGDELAASEQFLKIVSAFRSPAYQDQLRQQSPNSGTAGLAKNSPHFTGRALDLYVGGEPVSTEDRNRALQTQTKVYRWLVRNAARFGFTPYFYEPWHWEYQPR
jgi:D-alanyl-D-alanine carboxypeptidase